RVQRVDHHLAVDRPGDLDPPVEEVVRRRRYVPVPFADRARLGEKVRPRAALSSQRQQLGTPRPELALQEGHEVQSLARKHVLVGGGEKGDAAHALASVREIYADSSIGAASSSATPSALVTSVGFR